MGKTRGLHIELATNVYHPGQIIQGKVTFEAEEDFQATVVKIVLEGDARVKWSEGGEHKTTYTNHENYVYNEVILQQGSGNDLVTVHRGLHTFSFSFQLPPCLPSTFVVPQGRVKYVLKASIHRPWALTESVVRELNIMSLLDLNLNPEAMRSVDADNEKTVCCLCCATGPITANLHIDRSGYVPGETIAVRGSCENRSTRKCSAQLRIIMHTLCIGQACCCTKQRTFDQEVFRHNLPIISARGRQTIDGERFVLPPLPPSELEYCSIMTNSYTLEYTIDPGPSINLKVPVHLIVGSIPLEAFTSSTSATSTLYPPLANSSLTTNRLSRLPLGNQTSDKRENLKPQYGFYDWNKHESILNDR